MEKINKAPKLYTHEGYDTVPKSLASKSDFLPSYLLAQQQGALTSQDLDNALIDRVSSLEIYELLYKITDPEYPYTLGQLNVVNLHDIKVQYGDQPSATGGGCCGSCNCSNKKEGVEMKGMNSTKDEYSGSEGGVGLDTIEVTFTPTVPHCSMATLIGLCIRVCLLRSMVDKFKISVKVKEGSHNSENAINKQLNDKERVAAALENTNLLEVVEQCLTTVYS